MEEFIPPPEAPVFQPTTEEFKDPIAYITKIRPVVVNTGICKIRPPAGWKPPFAVDVETFKFTPRLQPLNELEAKTRVKLNFLENLAKFWELQGIVFKIPNVDRHPLDLHGLFKVVTKMGGYQEVCRLRKWATVAKELSYYYVTVASSLKVNYEKYLYPYEIFLFTQKSDNSPTKPTCAATQPKCKYGLRQKRRTRSNAEDLDEVVDLDKTNPEFKKLAFTAPGPKNSFAPLQREDYRQAPKKKELNSVEEKQAQKVEIKTEGGVIPCRGELGEDRYVSARTHPLIIPSERYVSARTHPPPIRRMTTVHTESMADPSRTGTTSSSTGSNTDNGTGMGSNESGMESSISGMGTSDSGMGTTVQFETGTSSCTNSTSQTANSTTAEPTTVEQETQSVSPQTELTSVDDSRSLVKSEVTEDGSQSPGSGEHVFLCGAELSDPMDTVKCVTCGSGDYDDELLLCDGCDDSHHMFCLDPPLLSLPPGEWRCPNCVAEECNKPQDSFGFEQAEKQYNLRTFGQMANNFKQEYFGRPTHEVPYSMAEKEFWRLVSSIEDEVVVEYGADLHTSRVGSGFPWEKTVSNNEEEKYANSPWNLNRLPNSNGCVLKYIDADISGMKVPWAYVGMCFSCFCWHIEDHWSYSINYLHWGEPKTWYGVPSAYAESLEATMKEQAPELFENHADLMHDLVTTLSPTVLMKNGIPVVRTDQCAGEFVVTFPRAYHAGFNQGFNFAEAVNFLLADWITMGRASIDHYSSFNRSPVFSHDELVCKMMVQYDTLDLCLLISTSKDATVMIHKEEEFRRNLLNKGYVREQRELFEIVKDEDRLCVVCKTYCFLSAVKCSCGQHKLACPKHIDGLCECPASRKVLKYRYTMPELHGMLSALIARKEAYVSWVARVEAILDSAESTKTDVQILRDLLEEASERCFTESKVCEELLLTLQDVKKCVNTALQIGNGKHRTRHTSGKCLDASGLREFLEQVEGLPCLVPEAESLRAKLTEVENFQQEASTILSHLVMTGDVQSVVPSADLEALIKRGEEFEVYVPEVKALKVALQQTTWISETESRLVTDKLTIDTLKTMHKLGSNLSHGSVAVERTLSRVKQLLTSAQDWEQQTKNTLKQKPPQTVEYLTSLLAEAQSIPVVLPSEHTITDALEKAKNWSLQAKVVQESNTHPQYTTLKTLLDSARSVPVRLELMAQLESCYTAAKAWYDRASRAFMKKNSNNGLLEVLLPRNKANFFLRHVPKGPRKKVETDFSHYEDPLTDVLGDREKEVAKIHEIETMEKTFADQLRTENSQKTEHDDAIKAGTISGPPSLYCFCQKPESGYMLQCELCLEWYHASCLRLPKGKQAPDKGIGKYLRFLCSFCQRTRRPRLDTIVSLLISLQKVPVSITEGSALQCLAERAIAWQRKARQSITSVTLTLEAARTQQKRIEEIKGHICRWRTEAKTDQTNPASSIQTQLANSAGSVLHHYESELERHLSKYVGLGPTRRSNLDNLLMEGDLLEVTLDEVQQLWQLLQQDAQLLTSFQEKGAPETEKKPSSLDELTQRRKRKRKEPSPALSTASTNSVSSEALKGPPSKKPKRKTKPTVKASLSPSNNPKTASSQAPSTSVGSEVPSVNPASRKTRERSTGSASSNEGLGCSEEVLREDEEESECSAEKCLQPVAEEISWVQCDCCQGWFHCMCVGLTKEYAEKIESYNCMNCKDVKTTIPQQKGPTTPQQKGPTTPQQAGPTTPQPKGPTTPQPKGPNTPQRTGPTTPQQAGSAKVQISPLPNRALGSLSGSSPASLRRGFYELARALQNTIAKSKP